ncbi:MAG: uroporphyrinogen decarboxylase family protein [Candidatus Thorarchaeota archaeon]
MVLSKRERVIRTLEHSEEPDVVPIHTLGFEKSNTAYQTFIKTDEYTKNKLIIKNTYRRGSNNYAGDITEQRFWNVDCWAMDPFARKLNIKTMKAPPEYPNSIIEVIGGRVMAFGSQVETDLPYAWYVDGWFKTPEILYSIWDEHGRPSELLNDNVNYSPQIWDEYVESLSPYLYPMANLLMPMFENMFEGMTAARLKYYMRKKPGYIHDVMNEYTKANLGMIKRLAEAGVDVAIYYDDLGMKGRSLFSIQDLQKFIIPYYKMIYQECKKHSMFIVQHSCGYIDEILPYMVDVGLDCIQALEPAAGVNLGLLKDTLGDKISFMGGIDSSRILNFGSSKEIEEHVKTCIRTAGKGGGYFVGPSHNILNAPWENCITLRDAMIKHQKYPLQ